MRKVSLERYYFVLYDGALSLKMSKMVLNSFCDKTLQLDLQYITGKITQVLQVISVPKCRNEPWKIKIKT